MLFERLRAELRARHYSPSTEQSYVAWARRLVKYHRRHPRVLGEAEIKQFLDHLVSRGASASTHQQALCAIVFLYERVLRASAPWINGLARPRRPRSLPVGLSKAEVRGPGQYDRPAKTDGRNFYMDQDCACSSALACE
jgi:site-specific recombinase XerD